MDPAPAGPPGAGQWLRKCGSRTRGTQAGALPWAGRGTLGSSWCHSMHWTACGLGCQPPPRGRSEPTAHPLAPCSPAADSGRLRACRRLCEQIDELGRRENAGFHRDPAAGRPPPGRAQTGGASQTARDMHKVRSSRYLRPPAGAPRTIAVDSACQQQPGAASTTADGARIEEQGAWLAASRSQGTVPMRARLPCRSAYSVRLQGRLSGRLQGRRGVHCCRRLVGNERSTVRHAACPPGCLAAAGQRLQRKPHIPAISPRRQLQAHCVAATEQRQRTELKLQPMCRGAP